MSPRRRRQVPVFLILIAMAVGWLTFQHNQDATIAADETEPAPPKTASVDPLPPEPTFSMPPIGNFSEIVERPIFIQSRRAPTEEASVIAEPERSPLDVVLVGVVVTSQERLALVRPVNGGDVSRLAEGDKIKGWNLITIQPDQVTFQRDEVETSLELQFEAPAPRPKPTRRDRRKRRQKQQQNQAQQQNQDEATTQNQNRRQRQRQNQTNE